MGYLITDVKVTLDYERKRDQPFHFRVITDGTNEDMFETIGNALEQKRKENEITSEDIQNTRSIKIDADDGKGYFATIVGDVAKFFKSL